MHWFVGGKTGHGKSRLMRERIVPYWLKQRKPVLVLDPLRQPWGATLQTDDPHAFLAMMRQSRGCVGVWDECGTMCHSNPKLARELEYLATISRNDGHLMYFLSQRLWLVPPTFRYQCSKAFLFRMEGARDRAEAVEMFGEPTLEPVLPTLLPGECIVVKPCEKPVKTRIF